MTHAIRIVFSLFLLAAATLAAESVTTRTGATFVGEITVDQEAKQVTVRTVFPSTGSMQLTFGELTPASLYWIQARRAQPGDAQQHVTLAELAEAAGMPGIAISEYLFAIELAPDRRRSLERRIEELTEMIAAAIIDDARAFIDQGSPNTALLYLHSVMELYPDTSAARVGSNLVRDLGDRLGSSSMIAEETISQDRVAKALSEIAERLDRGQEVLAGLDGHIGSSRSSSAHRRKLDKAIRQFEKAWAIARTLPATHSTQALEVQVNEVRLHTRDQLVATYLDAASLQVQRGAIPKAEDYCSAACELDPSNETAHEVHRLILETKAYGL